MITFSDGFFSDILTYAFRNHQSLIERHCELAFLDSPSTSLWDAPFDLIAMNMRVTCVKAGDGHTVKPLSANQLIFTFDEIMRNRFASWGSLPEIISSTIAVVIFLLAAFCALVLNIQIITMSFTNGFHRCQPLFKFFFDLVKNLWHSSGSLVF